MLSTKQLKDISSLYGVIGNRHRLHIISLLIGGEMNVGEINKTIKVSQPALSQNLGELRNIGILGSRRDKRKIYYYINNPHMVRLLNAGKDMVEFSVKGEK